MRFRMVDGAIVDTGLAAARWEEQRDWDGRNMVSRPTGDQWQHETLYKSKRGRYYIVHTSDWQGTRPAAVWIEDRAAARWLILNDYPLPADLAGLAEDLVE